MSAALAPNTQAILLLTAPLIAGRGGPPPELLSARLYNELARHLRDIQHEPADLISAGAQSLIHDCHSVVDEARLHRLLERGFLLAQAIERWHARAIWVTSRAETGYPRRLKTCLKENAPPVLYGCGNQALLEAGGLAVVGSRNVSEALTRYAGDVGSLAAAAGITIVSGGARGIDQAAMLGALQAGGTAIGILADSLERHAMSRSNRDMIMHGKLILLSPYDPNIGFNVGHAMRRNPLIYALSDMSIVVSSDLAKGGTWAGAIEQLDRFQNTTLYVRSSGDQSDGLDALRGKGARPWPNPRDADTLKAMFDTAGQASVPSLIAAADQPFEEARARIQHLLASPMREADIAATLHVPAKQVKTWLRRLVDEGSVEKQHRPVRYISKQQLRFDGVR